VTVCIKFILFEKLIVTVGPQKPAFGPYFELLINSTPWNPVWLQSILVLSSHLGLHIQVAHIVVISIRTSCSRVEEYRVSEEDAVFIFL
jgi:hypothetical protein